MKNFFTTIALICTILIFVSCDSDDSTVKANYEVLSKSAYPQTIPNENGKYTNGFAATIVTPGNHPVKGHVVFTIKDYGKVQSEEGQLYFVPSENRSSNVFVGKLETPTPIDESYLLNAEFVLD
ncbi:hypothetical protein [Paenimyroides ceti]